MKEAQSLIDSYSRKHDDVWKSGHHQGSACIRYFDSIILIKKTDFIWTLLYKNPVFQSVVLILFNLPVKNM